MTWTRRRKLLWVPTLVVLAVVLIAGSRMIALSVRHDAAVARETAATVANSSVRKIEPLLQKLADLAERRAALAAQVPAHRETLASLESLPPAAKTFWMTSDDKVLGSRPAEAATANGIASEWRSADSAHTVPGSAVLGPMRLGSQWLDGRTISDNGKQPFDGRPSGGGPIARLVGCLRRLGRTDSRKSPRTAD